MYMLYVFFFLILWIFFSSLNMSGIVDIITHNFYAATKACLSELVPVAGP